MNLVLVGVYAARAVVSVSRQVYVVRLESFRNHAERPVSRPEWKHSLRSVGLDQGDFVIVFVDVFEFPVDRDVVDHDPRINCRFDKAVVEVKDVCSVFQPRCDFFHLF